MIANQLQPLANHLWQSTVFAIAAALLTFLLKENGARIRYRLWLAASVKFFIPFSILTSAGSYFVPHAPVEIAPSGLPSTIEQFGIPFGSASPTVATTAQTSPAPFFAIWLGVVWAVGFVALVCLWWLRWRRTRTALRTASPLDLPIYIKAMTSPAFGEPGVFGIRRPILLLPDGITDCLTPLQLEAIVTHELCHVRRRDNLAAATHMAVEALFWFHPLVWWIGARLMDERERACDEEVLRKGSDPQVYSEGILKICELYMESPLRCMAGVTGGDLKRRIEEIMLNRITPELSSAKKTVLAIAGTVALALPVLVGVLAPSSGRSATAPRPRFAVASIKPCNESSYSPPGASGEGRGGGGGDGRNTGDAGTLRLPCRPAGMLIVQAYLMFANGEAKPLVSGANPPIRGGPAWIDTARYTINAKPERPQTMAMMVGPMMQTLLEDRFKLKIHRGSKEVPVYDLVVARGGPKLQPARGCPVNLPPPCSYQNFTDAGMDTYGWTMAALCQILGSHVSRTVIDKTGITGAFDFHLNIPAPPPPGADANGQDYEGADPLGAVMAGLEKLGLKLKASKATAEFVVIDRIERPSEN